MNILNIFRKPYLSTLFAMLILFASCDTYENDILESDKSIKSNSLNKKSSKLEDYVANHLITSSNLETLLLNEDNIDITILENSSLYFNDIEELKLMLIEAKVVKVNEIADLFWQIQSNTNNFLINSELKQNEAGLVIEAEINRQFDLMVLKYTESKSDCASYCYESYQNADFRCRRNMSIALAASAVSAFFTFGVGTAIGVGAAGTVFLICTNDAVNDWRACQANCK